MSKCINSLINWVRTWLTSVWKEFSDFRAKTDRDRKEKLRAIANEAFSGDAALAFKTACLKQDEQALKIASDLMTLTFFYFTEASDSRLLKCSESLWFNLWDMESFIKGVYERLDDFAPGTQARSNLFCCLNEMYYDLVLNLEKTLMLECIGDRNEREEHDEELVWRRIPNVQSLLV